MDYRDVVFLSVAENLSFSKAAEELFISQPAVSKHIKELENKYNTNLFERKGNKIYLTHAGKQIYNTLKKIARQYRDLEFEISQLNKSASGEFVVGASSTISQYVVPRIIAAFHQLYPNINIYLISGNSFDMKQRLQKNEIDLALVENESSHSDLKYINFLDDELITVTGAGSVYAKRKTITMEDLQQIPIVLREKGSGTLEVIRKALAKKNISIDKLNTLIHLGSTESIKNFLQDCNGIAIVSEKAVTTELYLNRLVKLNVVGLSIPRKFRIAMQQGHQSKLVNLFVEFLLGYNI